MSELIIESAKYGKFVVLYDECDEEIVKGKGYTWGINKGKGTFYAITHISVGNGKQKTLYMHRLIMDAPIGMPVDHISHCGFDNRRMNLRVCSSKENSQNQLKTKRKTTSQYKGVCWHKAANKWHARIQIDGKRKRKHLGLFSDEVAAACSYDDAALIHFGPYAQLNFPRPIIVNNITINGDTTNV